MAVLNLFIFTSAERDAAMAFNGTEPGFPGGTNPRAIDGSSPGVGLNLNDQAVNYEPGEPVTLTGAYVANKRMVDDPTYGPNLKAYLLTLPWATLEPETIFIPPE